MGVQNLRLEVCLILTARHSRFISPHTKPNTIKISYMTFRVKRVGVKFEETTKSIKFLGPHREPVGCMGFCSLVRVIIKRLCWTVALGLKVEVTRKVINGSATRMIAW